MRPLKNGSFAKVSKQIDVKTQVLGIGNSILSDDGVGIHVLECLKSEDILSIVPIHIASSHDIDFLTIFGLGEEILGKRLPSQVVIIAVEAADVTNFSEECTPPSHWRHSDSIFQVKFTN